MDDLIPIIIFFLAIFGNVVLIVFKAIKKQVAKQNANSQNDKPKGFNLKTMISEVLAQIKEEIDKNNPKPKPKPVTTIQSEWEKLAGNEEIKTNKNVINTNKEEMRQNNDGMRTNKEEMRTNKEEMRTNNDGMRTNKEEMRKNKEEMRTKNDGMRTTKDDMKTNKITPETVFSRATAEADTFPVEVEKKVKKYRHDIKNETEFRDPNVLLATKHKEITPIVVYKQRPFVYDLSQNEMKKAIILSEILSLPIGLRQDMPLIDKTNAKQRKGIRHGIQ